MKIFTIMNVNEIKDAVNESMEKNLPEVVEAVVSDKISNFESTTGKEIESMKEELKKFTLSQKKLDTKASEAFVKTAMVDIMKGVVKNGASTDAEFKNIVSATLKTMNEGTDGEGAELVFDQFERDLLRVINDYEVVSAVKLYQLAKGDVINFPKATNGITTAFVGEATDYGTPTEATTSYITINIAKAVTMTSMTEELLDDTMTIPDLYNLIVEFIGESQAEFLEDKILNGTLSATATVEGLLVNADVNNLALAAGNPTVWDITEDDLIDLQALVAKRFKRRTADVKRVMSQYTVSKLMQLRTTDGSRLLPDLTMKGGNIHGYDVVISDKMPVQNAAADVAGSTPIVFGDMKYFTLARRKGVSLERGYRTGDRQADIQSLKSNSRYGWKVTFGEAFAKLTTTA